MNPRIKIIVAFCISILILIFIGTYAYTKTNIYKNSSDWALHTQEVISEAQYMFSNIQDIETAQRGYIITFKYKYLEPYVDGLKNVDIHYFKLKELIKDNHSQSQLLDSIHLLAISRINFSKEVIAVRNNESFEKAQELTKTDLGQDLMKKIRLKLNAFILNENKALSIRLNDSEQNFISATTTILVSIFLTVIIILITLYFFLKDFNKRMLSEKKAMESELRIKNISEGLIIKNDELEKINQQLYEAEKFFILSLDMLVIASGEFFLKINPAFKNILGYNEEDLLAKPFLFFVHPDDVQATLDIVEKLQKGIPTIYFENRYRCKDNSYRWLAWAISPDISSGLLYAVAHDITELKNKEIELIKAKEYAEQLYGTQHAINNSTNLSIISTYPNGIIQSFNEGAEKMLGYKAEEVVNISSPDIFHDPNEVVARAEILTKELGYKIEPGFDVFHIKNKYQETDTNEWTYIRKDGTKIPIQLTCSIVRNKHGNIFGYMGIAEDITDRKKAENELKKAKETAEQSLIAKDAFLANMSHEIRTPMNAIIGFTDLIIQTELDKEQYKFIKNVKNAGENLLIIINDILDLSKIESGKLSIESYPFNLKEILKNTQSLLKEKAKEKKIECNYFLDTELPEFVVGDSNRLNQVMINLVGNAIKFTNEGKVTVSVKKIKEDEQDYALLFSIKDTGIGISEDKLDIIFERFTQANNDTTRKFGGTGLGLNIAKSLIEMQGGQLKVKSEEGKGSEFYFTIVYKKADNHIEVPMQHTLSSQQKYGKIKILLSEDNIINQELAKSVIKKFGFELHVVNNGKECVELLQTTSFDLILMDLQMPGMDGYQATRFIRSELKMNIPIIAMTAHFLAGEKEKCIEIGMNDYIPKPFKQHDLYNAIVSVLKHTPKNKNLAQGKNTQDMQSPSTIIRLSYLKELSHGDMHFEKKMFELFLKQMPVDIDLLKNALDENTHAQIASIAHKMKTSMLLFELNHFVAYLSKLEREGNQKQITPQARVEFDKMNESLLICYKEINAILAKDYQ